MLLSATGLRQAQLVYASDLQVTFVVTKAQGLHAMSDPPIGKGVTRACRIARPR